MEIQDNVVVFITETSGGFSTEPFERQPGELDMPFATRIIAKMEALSAANAGAEVYIATIAASGNVALSSLNVTDTPDSFIDVILG